MSKKITTFVSSEKKDDSSDELDALEDSEIRETKKELLNEKLKTKLANERKKRTDAEIGTSQKERKSRFVTEIMELAKEDPAKAREIMDTLGAENIEKLANLGEDNPRVESVFNLAKSPGITVKDIVEIVKLMRPENGGTSLKDIAEVFRLGMEATKSQRQEHPQRDPLEVFATVQSTIIKPFQDALNQKDQQVVGLQMQRLQDQIVDPMNWMKTMKTFANELGFGKTGGKSEVDLKLAEMQQMKDIEEKKLDWEREKHKLKVEADSQKLDTVKGILEGPVGDVIKSLGNAGANRIRRPDQSSDSQTITIGCPNCGKSFQALPGAARVACGHCGAVLEAVKPTTPNVPKTETPATVETLATIETPANEVAEETKSASA